MIIDSSLNINLRVKATSELEMLQKVWLGMHQKKYDWRGIREFVIRGVLGI